MLYSKKADLIVRIAVAFAFLSPPINAFSHPDAWVGYFPPFMLALAEGELLLYLFGIVEVGIALWLLSGWRVSFPALAAAAMLVAIVVFNPAELQVLFRDLSIAAAALALAIIHWPKKSYES